MEKDATTYELFGPQRPDPIPKPYIPPKLRGGFIYAKDCNCACLYLYDGHLVKRKNFSEVYDQPSGMTLLDFEYVFNHGLYPNLDPYSQVRSAKGRWLKDGKIRHELL